MTRQSENALVLGLALLAAALAWHPIVTVAMLCILALEFILRRLVLWVEDVNAQPPARVVAGQFYRPGVTPVDRVALAETWGQRGRP